MIQTDEQRRWWFATHPEYGWSRKGGRDRRPAHEPDHEKKQVRPEDVDAYVDDALPYLDGPVVDLLKSVKRHFGSEGASVKREKQPDAASIDIDSAGFAGSRGDNLTGEGEALFFGPQAGTMLAWVSFYDDGGVNITEYPSDAGGVMPRLPTPRELSRWPGWMLREFDRWFDAFMRNNPLIIDPNALERHHYYPKAFVKYFLDSGIKINEFVVMMRAADHRLKPSGVHTGEGQGGDWNSEWEKFMNEHPPQKTKKHRDRIEKKLQEMKKKFKVP
jgi:hypothetical protein